MAPKVKRVDKEEDEVVFALPSLDELKRAIPAHCFVKDWKVSTFYLLRDLAIIGALYLAKDYFVSNWLGYIIWVNLVGFFGWCLFVVGHDCGHGTFSNSWLFNQIMGHVAHTPLLVPFNGWQISHYKHHRFHNNVQKDESWKPVTKTLFDKMWITGHLTRRSPVVLLMYPWYLLSVPDHEFLSGSHFWPWSRLFSPDQRIRAGASTVSIIAWLGFLFYNFDFSTLVWYYFMPYYVFTAWLSLVTLLQHTDPKGVFYDDHAWSFKLGAIHTIDRTYGSIIDYFHHNIETHVVHHFFFTMIPHYHLTEATKAVKPLLGDAYIYDDTNFLKAFWRTTQECGYIAPVAGEKPGVYKYVPH